MTMEATEPLHWNIQVFLEPKDVRKAILLGLKPSVIWKATLALIFGRFSIFSKAEPEAEEKSPERTAPPVVFPSPSPPSQNEESPNPLARLKG